MRLLPLVMLAAMSGVQVAEEYTREIVFDRELSERERLAVLAVADVVGDVSLRWLRFDTLLVSSESMASVRRFEAIIRGEVGP